jgi:GNAT superfamily N-acetyltransferase
VTDDLRPLTPDDAGAAVALIAAAFRALDQAAHREPQDIGEERRAGMLARLARFPRTDPDGCWAAVGPDGLAGLTVAIRRGPVWGLSLLFVHPEAQGRGLGRQLLERVRPTAEGAAVELISASDDPRAIRRYLRLGLDLHPGVALRGPVDRTAIPTALAVRQGTAADLDLVDAVDAPLRAGAPRTADVAALNADGAALLVADHAGRRGFVVHNAEQVMCLGAQDEATAAHLLWAALAEVNADVELHDITAPQQWAIRVALAARMEVAPSGPMFVRGWSALPGPYLPSGVYF